MRKGTIYRQFITSFLLIVLPVILCGSILLLWQKNRIDRETEKNIASEVYYGTKRLEAQVKAVKNFQYYSFIEDSELEQFIQEYDSVPVYEYYSLLKAVNNRLNMLVSGNSGIQDAAVYIKDIGICISYSDVLTYISEEEYDELYRKVQETECILRTENGIMHSSQIYSYPRWDKKYEMIIDVCLSNRSVFNDILDQNLEEDSDFLIYDHESGELLSEAGAIKPELFEKIRSYTEADSLEEHIRTFFHKGQEYLLISEYSKYLNQSIYRCSTKEAALIDNLVGMGSLLIYLFFSVLVAVAFPFSVRRIVTIPIGKLIDAFHRLADNHMDEQITYRAADEFNYLYDEFNNMVLRLNGLIDENYKSKLLAQKAELKQLQSQIHPHFLYNTYFMLNRMIKDEDTEEALKLSDCLGIYMEYITHNAEQEVTLAKELYYVKSYLDIQQLRFGHRMRVQMEEIPEAFREFRVPRLTLQPIVENYLKYGYEMSDDAGELYLRFAEETDGISIIIGGGCVAVLPDAVEKLQKRLDAEEPEGEVTGLINIHRRLKIRYGSSSGVYLSRDMQGRLITRIYLKTGGENVSNFNS